MPSQARVSGSDSHAAGRGRQRLKLAAIGYANARHGLDTDAELLRVAVKFLCQMAMEFVATLPGQQVRGRRIDLYTQGNCEPIQLAAIAYASARHGVDADVGMAREGLALLCQAAIDFVESLPREDLAKRPDPHLQLDGGRA